MMRKTVYLLVVLLVVAALLAACGGSGSTSSQGSGGASSTQPTSSAGGTTSTAPSAGETATSGASGATTTDSGAASGTAAAGTGDAQAGATLFAAATIGTNPGCKTCHTLDGTKLVGPSLQGVGTRAATRVQGETAEQYLRTSIIDPNAYVVEGFTQGVMPSFKTVLDDTQLNNLVAYLLTLK
jgi:mono/diheme cytochrome c family protein